MTKKRCRKRNSFEWICCVVEMWETTTSGEDENENENNNNNNNNNNEPEVLFKARWLFSKSDVMGLDGNWRGMPSKETMLLRPPSGSGSGGESGEDENETTTAITRMHRREVFFSNYIDKNDISTIQGPCRVLYYHPPPDGDDNDNDDGENSNNDGGDGENNSNNELHRMIREVDASAEDYFCRYKLTISEEGGEEEGTEEAIANNNMVLAAVTRKDLDLSERGNNDHDTESSKNQQRDSNKETLSSNNKDGNSNIESSDDDEEMGITADSSSSSSDDEDDDDNEMANNAAANNNKNIMPEGEGSTLRDDIMVGDLHQVFVGPFVPRQPGESPRSEVRNNGAGPKLVWKPDQVSEEDLQEFLDGLAALHTP